MPVAGSVPEIERVFGVPPPELLLPLLHALKTHRTHTETAVASERFMFPPVSAVVV